MIIKKFFVVPASVSHHFSKDRHNNSVSCSSLIALPPQRPSLIVLPTDVSLGPIRCDRDPAALKET